MIHEVKLCKFELRVKELPEPIIINFVKTSSPQLHAEQRFCKKATKALDRNSTIYTPKDVSCTMLISNSPCSKCREDLQALFISCGVPVHFTLRIARLYLEKSKPDEAEIKLDYWIKDLEVRNNIVSLSAINVISEVAMLTTTRVSMNMQQRTDEDARISRQIDNIQNGTTHVKQLIKHFKLVWSDFTRTYFIGESDKQMILFQLIVSPVTRDENRPTVIRESYKMNRSEDHLGDYPVEVVIHKIESGFPLSWVKIRKCLVLVCAHVPSTECQEKITEFMKEKRLVRVKNKLVLYIKKVPVNEERRSFIEWIRCLENESIHVCLQPFYAPLPSLSHCLPCQAK